MKAKKKYFCGECGKERQRFRGDKGKCSKCLWTAHLEKLSAKNLQEVSRDSSQGQYSERDHFCG
jgi:predicted ATP-dependent serine protease